VTHREVARSFAVVTGSNAHGDAVDLSGVATATDTLVVLMAAGRLAGICADLIAAGRPADEPAAIVQWAWTRDQRSIAGPLGEIATLARAANVGPPATLVVGPVASLAQSGDPEASSTDAPARRPTGARPSAGHSTPSHGS
jgi:siroheme synthase